MSLSILSRSRASLFCSGLLGLAAVFVLTSRAAVSQIQASTPGFVKLQSGTPGQPQHGHANLDGTVIAGTFQSDLVYTSEVYANTFFGSGVGIYGLTLGGLDTTGATVGQVPVYDGSTVVWGSAGGTVTLPFAGSASVSGGAAASIENTATAGLSTGVTAIGNGNGIGLYAMNRNTTSGGYAIKALHNGNGTAVYSESVGGSGLLGANLTTGNFAAVGAMGYGVDAFASAGTGVRGRATGAGSGVEGYASSSSFFGVLGQNLSSNNYGYLGGRDYGVYGQTADNFGIYGFATQNGAGVGGQNTSTGSRGVVGDKDYGVFGSSNLTAGVFGTSNSSVGVYGRSLGSIAAILAEATASGPGLYATSNTGFAVQASVGAQNNNPAVYAYSGNNSNVPAIRGVANGSFGFGIEGTGEARGVIGITTGNGAGVVGMTNGTGQTYGVEGISSAATGGNGAGGYFEGETGLVAKANPNFNNNPYGVWASGPDAVTGVAQGGTLAFYGIGSLNVSGNKSFQIDHPLDPTNYYLLHYCTESPVPMNSYSGNVVTDAKGFAWVQLPDYFEAINKDVRYQLTVLDESDDFVLCKVAKPVQAGRFLIRTNKGRVAVSWRVEAQRNDAYNRAYPPKDVVAKEGRTKGTYMMPELFGQPEQRGEMYSMKAMRPDGSGMVRGQSGPNR